MVTGIRHTAVLVLGFALLTVALAACGGAGPSKANIEATVEARVSEYRAADVTIPVPPKPTVSPEPSFGEDFLQISSPDTDYLIVTESELTVSGRVPVNAVVSIDVAFVEVEPNGEFAQVVGLDPGPNIIEIVSSVPSGRQTTVVLVVICDC